MKSITGWLAVGVGLVFSFTSIKAQQGSDALSKINVTLESSSEMRSQLDALATVEPVPFASLPRSQRGNVLASGYWSMQNPNLPPLPGNFYNLDVWPLGDGMFVLDDRNVDYAALQAEAELDAKLTAAASLKSGGTALRMMMSSLAAAYAYGNPVYLTNLVVSTSGGMSATFDIAGGTNNVPYDILMTTNLLSPANAWSWLGIGYTDTHYSFANQPLDMAFYRLAKPLQTRTLAWGLNGYGQCDVPLGLTNIIMAAGGLDFSVVLKADGGVLAWGSNANGQTNVPADLTNATVVVAGYQHILALRADGSLSIWGKWLNGNYVGPFIPAGLTNVLAISAGVDHDIAANADGTVMVWGYTNTIYNTVPSGLAGVKDVEAGWNHNLALLTNGTVMAWGKSYDSFGWNVTTVPAGLSNVVAIAAGGYHSLALKSDGTVVAWGAGTTTNGLFSFLGVEQGQSIVPAGLSNVVAIAAGGYHSTALKKDGTVVMWGDMELPGYQVNQIIGIGGGVSHALALRAGRLRPPVFIFQSSATNLVTIYGKPVALSAAAIAPDTTNGFPLGYQWQFNGTNFTGTSPTNYNFTANDNTAGTYTLIASNAAGSTSGSWQVTLTNAIDVTQDLLLIYNTNSPDSKTVIDYYLAHRPGVGGANVLGIGWPGIFVTNYVTTGDIIGVTNATIYETVSPSEFTNRFLNPIQNWMSANSKQPQYVLLMLDVPSRVNPDATTGANYPFYYPPHTLPSFSYQIRMSISGWSPYVTHLNMLTTNDCIGYINKLEFFGTNYSPGQVVISASVGGYADTNFVLDNIRHGAGLGPDDYSGAGYFVYSSTNGLLASGVPTNNILFYDGTETFSNGIAHNLPHPTNITNMAGYICWGAHSSLDKNYAINNAVQWNGSSSWWIIRTEESANGQRLENSQCNFLKWCSGGAFGGTNYSKTPIGAVSYTDEPGAGGTDNSKYFGLWAAGKNFGVCAWESRATLNFQAVGDPFVKQ